MIFGQYVVGGLWPQKKKRTAFFVMATIILFTVGGLAYAIYLPRTAFHGKKEIVIAQGMGSRAIGALLKQEGIISSKWAFVIYVSLRGETSSLRPGQYKFFDTATIPEIARGLMIGAVREHAVTILEGWDSADIARYFALQNIAPEENASRFLTHLPQEITSRFSFLSERPKSSDLEGYFFPDTYRVFYDATLESIVIKMLDNFDRKMTPDLRAEITRQKKTIFEIITMASLIEKEVASDEDRAIVSGILWKRLSIGIPLQVDATVAYAAHKEGTKISLADKKINSPYNTYRYPGLPRGPIANPGFSAMHAAIYPHQSPYLYYLSASDGRTIFSKTLEEHNVAKAKYLK